jgi:flagellin FlaB
MVNKFNRFCKGLHRGQKGITGLETAIILIAFVTVASVLAYSVLSAGIFSSEKGKAAVYEGLDQATSSMQLRGDVLALSSNGTTVDEIQFTVASVLQDAPVDMTDAATVTNGTWSAATGKNSVVVNFNDSGTEVPNILWTKALVGAERGTADMLDANEAMVVTVKIPAGAVMLTAATAPYSTFTLQIVPPKGAAITITRTLPGVISSVMDLH